MTEFGQAPPQVEPAGHVCEEKGYDILRWKLTKYVDFIFEKVSSVADLNTHHDHADLMQRMCEGDSQGFELHSRIYDAWVKLQAMTYYKRYHVVGMKADDDIVQELRIKLLTSKSACGFVNSDEIAWRNFLTVCIRNQVTDAYRAMKSQRRLADAAAKIAEEKAKNADIKADDEDAAEVNAERLKARLALIARCAESLPPRQKQLFELRSKGISSAKCAKEMQISLNVCYKYWSQATKKIRDCAGRSVA